MKASCVILTVVVVIAIMSICVMVKFATELTVEERRREELSPAVAADVIAFRDRASQPYSARYPYVAAITRNTSTTWSMACFASLIQQQYLITTAHCRSPKHMHRALIFADYARNYTHTYPVLYWRVHDNYSAPYNDIALVRIDMTKCTNFIRLSLFDTRPIPILQACVWKTVATMDRRVFLTNELESYYLPLTSAKRCELAYGIVMNPSLLCVDLSSQRDCFVHEFGPLYYADKVAGLATMLPRDCDLRVAVFTNVSYHGLWILANSNIMSSPPLQIAEYSEIENSE